MVFWCSRLPLPPPPGATVITNDRFLNSSLTHKHTQCKVFPANCLVAKYCKPRPTAHTPSSQLLHTTIPLPYSGAPQTCRAAARTRFAADDGTRASAATVDLTPALRFHVSIPSLERRPAAEPSSRASAAACTPLRRMLLRHSAPGGSGSSSNLGGACGGSDGGGGRGGGSSETVRC